MLHVSSMTKKVKFFSPREKCHKKRFAEGVVKNYKLFHFPTNLQTLITIERCDLFLGEILYDFRPTLQGN